MKRLPIHLALAALLTSAVAGGQEVSDPPQPLEDRLVFNIVDWEGGELPPIYERSVQLPLALEEVLELSKAEFSDEAIVEMLEQRRCACDASVSSIVRLKKAGVSEPVIQATSLHSIRPNRHVNLAVHLDFEGRGQATEVSRRSRRSYLYLIIPDGDRERVFFGNLQAILAGRWHQDALLDHTDLLLPKKTRRVSFTARVPLKTHGIRKALVFTSTRPNIYTSADIPGADRSAAQEFSFDYPVASLRQDCSLQILQRQDALLDDRWHLERSHFECEWD
ncbi:MAG: hypothetical protein VX733_03060 [Candidatus Latescibacterota bacterium]|nr:hypothetical protein [Candidatus Latescibacterota bacterium]